MSIKINLGAWSSVFAVPSQVVDEGLKFSDGVKLKVLLYVLRHSDSQLDENSISKATGVNVTDIPEALDYWVSLGILSKEDNVYFPPRNCEEDKPIITFVNSNNEKSDNDNSDNEIKDTESEKEPPKQRFVVSKPQKPDFMYTAQRLAVDEELKFLADETQIALGKTLSTADVSSLLMLKDTCGLPPDVILMLIQYCLSIEKGNMRTIEKIGVQWADDGIYTVEAAENKIKQISTTNKRFSIISSAFGIKNAGSPTKKQLEYADKWIGEWKFSPEMLREAYERCVDTKGNMNLRYIDGILKRWNANGIHSAEELAKFEKSSAKPKENKKSSYDIDELEKIDTLYD